MRLYKCSATCSTSDLFSYNTRLFWIDYPYYILYIRQIQVKCIYESIINGCMTMIMPRLRILFDICIIWGLNIKRLGLYIICQLIIMKSLTFTVIPKNKNFYRLSCHEKSRARIFQILYKG